MHTTRVYYVDPISTTLVYIVLIVDMASMFTNLWPLIFPLFLSG